MKSLKGSETEKNLLKSFAGESQARGRYELFAKQAKKEGYEQIMEIFLETSDNERVHAKKFFSFLEGGMVEITAFYPAGKVGTTAENLKAAAMGEEEEYTVLYPGFAEVAEKEGYAEIAAVFRLIAKVETAHHDRFIRLLDRLEKGYFKRDEVKRWKCRKCGYIHEGKEPPAKCPACSHPQGYFEIDRAEF